jgi:hypothetical protein
MPPDILTTLLNDALRYLRERSGFRLWVYSVVLICVPLAVWMYWK